MIKNLVTIFALVAAISAWSQENRFTLGGGYAFANVEDIDTDATGWRINGLYEFVPNASNFAHGISFGYIGTSADISLRQSAEFSKYKINSWPIYYAPKFTFGSASAKGFIKGALGLQISNIKRTGPLVEVKDNDTGFYGGASVGFMKIFQEKMFVNVEYEWAYLSNSFYKDGFMNSAMLGFGLIF